MHDARRSAVGGETRGADRRRMGTGPPPDAASTATDRTATPRSPHAPGRDRVGPADPLLLAGPAARVRQMGDRLQALQALVGHRLLAAPAQPPGRRPRRAVALSDAVRGVSETPVWVVPLVRSSAG